MSRNPTLPLAALALAFATAVPLAAQQLGPAGTGGIAALDRTVSHLATNKRVLLIAAHPDDEDEELLTLLSREMGADVAYLSLSRGEGGQNLIGPELGEALGLIRTGELLSAGAIDGAHQYFTRGFDFGFSKTLAETQRFWTSDTILADVVRVIRRFRPQILLTSFSGTPRDGHGQHQMSSVVAQQAFALLRDSAWGPRKLYRLARFDSAVVTLRLRSGQLDPTDGRSITQLGLAARSLHRTQDMGQLQRIGFSQLRLALVASAVGAGAADDGLFTGVDTTLPRVLGRYRLLVDSARAAIGPRSLDRVASLLAQALQELRARGPADFRAAREPMLEEALASASGVVVDAAADDGRIAPGETFTAAIGAWTAAGATLHVDSVALEAPRGWTTARLGEPEPGETDPIRAGFVTTTGVDTRRFSVTVPADAEPTTPYFLQRPLRGALYDWGAAPDSLRGEALDPPLLSARVALTIGGTAVTLRREVSQRFNDQASGEVRRPLLVVPRVGVSVSPGILMWPVGSSEPRTVMVELVHGARGHSEGEVRLELPAGWPEVPPQRFALDGEDVRRSFRFAVRAPLRLTPGSYVIQAVAQSPAGREDRMSLVVDYPHIRPTAYVTSATVRVEAAQLALPTLRRVGYVRGAADGVPDALADLGVPVTLLGPEDLERADLSGFDVIVVGPRAYETDSALIANNGRLLDYARAGGRLIVQYQQYQFVNGSYAPFRLTIARPHDRVTDETAPVRVLRPDDPLFRTPNAIGPADWDGWVQERGLYFAHEWDPAYRPTLEMGDAGERLQGGLLVAPLGRGLYIYTGLSFFRELPAGVPGAYRLFLNMLGLEPTNVP